MALGGWKDHKTLLDCYQHTDVESMPNALASSRVVDPPGRQQNRSDTPSGATLGLRG